MFSFISIHQNIDNIDGSNHESPTTTDVGVDAGLNFVASASENEDSFQQQSQSSDFATNVGFTLVKLVSSLNFICFFHRYRFPVISLSRQQTI